MQQPPAQAEVASICLEVVSVCLLEVVVVVVLEADPRRGVCCGRCGERDDGSEVVAAAEEVELDAGEECEKG